MVGKNKPSMGRQNGCHVGGGGKGGVTEGRGGTGGGLLKRTSHVPER